ncbi:helix-turn-helix domain-containing protein [Natrarchaeobius chitinivorans]|uniref:DNA-binding protein n=1 Tax=Natrarchaeobius chitinivorans TaxID=1679083 RepID=A0A3N6LWZ7_NATCH|nr:helix-turn-helix domain-containing protein [Natrarchaeobius chitinivorans]RQG92264.1 DNA-binding protein [Natrarchaeobius chitinivorans]
MSSGIRAEVKIDDPADCIVTRASAAVDGRTHSVSKSTNPTAPERVTEEFVLEAEESLDSIDVDAEVSAIFEYGSGRAYRFERELGRGCPCETVERFDSPVVDVRTQGSSLYLAFHATGMGELQSIIGELQERHSNLDVQRLLQSQQEGTEQHLVFVDRSRLTARQREVLETAHRMGYFEHPKGANAGEVAAELEISGATFSEHVAAAQTKLLDAILDYGTA